MFSRFLCTVSLLMLMLWNTCASERDIYVSPSGNDSSSCTEEISCKTLDHALTLAAGLNSTRILLDKVNYTITKNHNFNGMVTFIPENGLNLEDIKITFDAKVSLSFIQTDNRDKRGLGKKNHPTTQPYHPTIKAKNIEKQAYYKVTLFVFLLIAIPFGLVILILIMVIMLIDLDFFTGYLNSWLYSYEVMKLVAPDKFKFILPSKFLIALSGMPFQGGGYTLPLVQGLDNADKLMIMYIMPLYVITTVVALVKVVGAYPDWRFSRRVRASFRGICTILVLCYTDITNISLTLLRRTVLFFDGEIEYFSAKHLWYGIVAIFFIVVFVIPFPVFLLFRPWLTNRLRPVLNLNRWNPFFDALQNSFKDQYRWCAAFYFVCRLGIWTIYTFMPASTLKRLLLESCCILILVIFAILRPYKEARDVKEGEKNYDWIYKSDIVLLTTLSLIAVVSSPLDNSCAPTDGVKKGLKTTLNILSCVPVAVLLFKAIYAVRKYLRSRRRPSSDDEAETSENRYISRESLNFSSSLTTTDYLYGSI